MSLIEPGLWVFRQPEHEFQRIAVLASPDWQALQLLGRLGLDWRRLWHVPQLDGVMCWRILDPHMDGIVPEAAREECRGHLDALAHQQWEWPDDVRAILSRLEKYKVRHVVFRGAVTYGLYRMSPEWPRRQNHIDVITHPEDYEAAASAAESLGRDPDVRQWKAPWETVGVIGTPFHCCLFTVPPGFEYVHGTCLWDSRLVDSRRRSALVGDVEAWVPDPSRHFAVLAFGVLIGIVYVPEPLTMNNLARLYNLSRQPDFSWDTVWEHLRVSFSETLEPTFTFGPYREVRADTDATWQLGCDEAVGAAWVIAHLADAYEIAPGALAKAQAILARQQPYFPVFDPDAYATSPHARGNPLRHEPMRDMICRWASLPMTEELLFCGVDPVNTRGRIAAGMYDAIKKNVRSLCGEKYVLGVEQRKPRG